LWLYDQKYTSFDINWVYMRACEKRVSASWLHGGCLTENSATLMVWEVLASACQAESPGIRCWVTKHVTEICSIGKWLERWQWQNHSQCRHCNAMGEDYHHVYQYPARCADQMASFNEWLSKSASITTRTRICLR
jgi:hypothetical protein